MATNHLYALGANTPGWTSNLIIERGTTAVAGDSVVITSVGSTALSSTNPGYVTLPSGTAGDLATFQVTADVTINLTGAHWELGTTGDVTGGLLRVLAINDNGTLRWGVAELGGRNTLLTTDTNATATNINLAEEVLCTAAVASATNSCIEIGFVRADFDDTGGSSEDLWTIQSGINDIYMGITADGYWQPFNSTTTGFTSDPITPNTARWTQVGRTIHYFYDIPASASDATTMTFTLPADNRVDNI